MLGLGLGLWLFVSGIALAGIEAFVLEKAINALLDMRDDRIEARLMTAMDKTISDRQKGIEPNTSEKTGGLVTASPEFMRLKAQRLAAQCDKIRAVVSEPETRQPPRLFQIFGQSSYFPVFRRQ